MRVTGGLNALSAGNGVWGEHFRDAGGSGGDDRRSRR